MTRLGRLASAAYSRFVFAVDRDPIRAGRWLLLACVPLLVLTVGFFSHIRAGLEDLLPPGAPSVTAIARVHDRVEGRANLIVVATSDSAASNRRFIDRLGERLSARHIPEARLVQLDCRKERAWLAEHAALLLPEAAFSRIADELEAAIDDVRAGANPFFVDLDTEGAGPGRWRRTRAILDEAQRENDRFPGGYFETRDGSTVLAVVWLRGSETERGPADALYRAVREEVSAIRGEFPAGLRVGYSGEVMNLIEAYDAVSADLARSSLAVFVSVSLLIAFYFRSLRALAVVLVGLGLGLLMTFALGRLTVGSVNSNTGFLGSIIAGNGINHPILLLAYYRAEGPHLSRREAMIAAARKALPGTLGAALTSAAAYGALAASSFRGFSQFGWLGGAGMLTVWLGTFVATPVAIALLDPPRGAARPTATHALLFHFHGHPRWSRRVACALLATGLSCVALGARAAAIDGVYDMNLLHLVSRDSQRGGSQAFAARVGEVFGVWFNASVAMVDEPAELAPTVAALERALVDTQPRLGARIDSIERYAPPPAAQALRLRRLREIALKMSEIPRSAIPEAALAELERWLSPDHLRPITQAEVPVALTRMLAERSGRVDRLALVFPAGDVDFNDARNVIAFRDRVRAASLPAGAVVGGSFLLMAEMFQVISAEAARVMLLACLLVAALLLPLFARTPLRIARVVITVALVALTAQSATLALGVQINFFNFAAMPITVGVGADYLINLYGAMDAFSTDGSVGGDGSDGGAVRRACARMGGAILLCSLTTMVGYASLLLAGSGALRSFGFAAALGELFAITTALLVLPAFER